MKIRPFFVNRVSSSGELKLADFGLAKTYDFEMKLTSVVCVAEGVKGKLLPNSISGGNVVV